MPSYGTMRADYLPTYLTAFFFLSRFAIGVTNRINNVFFMDDLITDCSSTASAAYAAATKAVHEVVDKVGDMADAASTLFSGSAYPGHSEKKGHGKGHGHGHGHGHAYGHQGYQH